MSVYNWREYEIWLQVWYMCRTWSQLVIICEQQNTFCHESIWQVLIKTKYSSMFPSSIFNIFLAFFKVVLWWCLSSCHSNGKTSKIVPLKHKTLNLIGWYLFSSHDSRGSFRHDFFSLVTRTPVRATRLIPQGSWSLMLKGGYEQPNILSLNHLNCRFCASTF